VELVIVETAGDRDRSAPLSEIGGQGIFAKEVQQALLDDLADVAVHSAKDLPSSSPPGLELSAVPERVDPADALVGRSLAGLGPGATVATGSPRRRALLLDLRPDLNVVELRGNMATRFAQAGQGGVDAVVAAVAALERLGQRELLAERFDPLSFTPQVGQGAIALETRIADSAGELVSLVDDPDAHRCLEAERAFLVAIGAGCSVPAGAWCRDEEGELVLRAVMADDRGRLHRSERRGTAPLLLGLAAAEELAPIHGGSL
jgi:hydroxymethylbilane synthase